MQDSLWKITGLFFLLLQPYEKACNNHIYESCVFLGNIFLNDKDKAQQKKSIPLFKTAITVTSPCALFP